MKHTPEPWRVEVVTTRGLPGPYITADLAGGGDIADLYILSEMDECIPKECAEANAVRIVACVNACEGMDDPAAEIARLRSEHETLLEEVATLRSMELDDRLGDGYISGEALELLYDHGKEI